LKMSHDILASTWLSFVLLIAYACMHASLFLRLVDDQGCS